MTERARVTGETRMAEAVAQAHKTRRRVILVGAIGPIAVALVAASVMASWIPRLSAILAVHWGPGGPDGLDSVVSVIPFPFGLVVLFGLVVVSVIPFPFGLVILFGFVAVGASWKTRPSGLITTRQKIITSLNPFLAGMIGAIGMGSLAIQLGARDPSQVDGIGYVVAAAFAIGIVLGLAGWLILPKADDSLPATTDPIPLDVTASERVVWSSAIRATPIVTVVIGAAIVLVMAAVIVTVVYAGSLAALPAAVLVLLALLAVGTSYWRVTVDRHGFMVRSVLGWPAVFVPMDDIRSVHVVEVNPTADFGGWGYRWAGHGRSGIVMRSGAAIEVTRASGKRFVVTADDSPSGAAVLAALLARRGGAHPPAG
ncbi:MAG: hypothetical protein JWM70_1201 [Microbacteriaceae bacterium]|nr:hypothetical protein [Microbacteriaceae bacterium]